MNIIYYLLFIKTPARTDSTVSRRVEQMLRIKYTPNKYLAIVYLIELYYNI